MASQLHLFDEPQAREGPFSPTATNTEEVLRINILASPPASTSNLYPNVYPHVNMYIYKVMWICGFVTIGTDIKELTWEVRSQEMWKVKFVLMMPLNSSVSCQHKKKRVERTYLSQRDSYQSPRETGIESECPLIIDDNLEAEASLTQFASTHPPIHSGWACCWREHCLHPVGKLWINLLKALMHRLLCEHSLSFHSGEWGFSGSHGMSTVQC